MVHSRRNPIAYLDSESQKLEESPWLIESVSKVFVGHLANNFLADTDNQHMISAPLTSRQSFSTTHPAGQKGCWNAG